MNVGQAQSTRFRCVLQGSSSHFGVGLGAIVGLDPHHAAVYSVLASQAHNGSLIECMASSQVIGPSAIELAVGRSLAKIQAVVVDDETVAQRNDLASKGQVNAILAQNRKEFA
ncbi:hypothetical protein D3C86_1896530 [compost metagenome]